MKVGFNLLISNLVQDETLVLMIILMIIPTLIICIVNYMLARIVLKNQKRMRKLSDTQGTNQVVDLQGKLYLFYRLFITCFYKSQNFGLLYFSPEILA